MKLLLTSAGFANQAAAEAFTRLVEKPASELRVLFIPTAAQSGEALRYVDTCRKELLGAGIDRSNIHIYDLDRRMTEVELGEYDAVYVCGGDTRYLLKRVKRAGFDKALKSFCGLYVGVSAGSLIAAAQMDIGRVKMAKGLGLVNCGLRVHCQEGLPPGTIDTVGCPLVALTDRQALVIENGQVMRIQ